MKQRVFFAGLVGALAAVVVLSLCSGQYDISAEYIVAYFAHAVGLPVLPHVVLTPEQEAVLLHIRLPRTLVGLMVGAGLGISGAVLQGIFSNPLADPGIIGVSSGASVGAVLAIGLGVGASSVLLLPAFAFVGAMLAVGLTVSLSMRHGRIPVMTLLLSGVVVGMFLAACTAAILTVLNEQKMQQYLFWTIGGLDYRRWDHVLLGIGPIGVGASVMLLLARHLNLLAFGEVGDAVSPAVPRACGTHHGDGGLHQRQHRIRWTGCPAHDALARRPRSSAAASCEPSCGCDISRALRLHRADPSSRDGDTRRHHDGIYRYAVFLVSAAASCETGGVKWIQ